MLGSRDCIALNRRDSKGKDLWRGLACVTPVRTDGHLRNDHQRAFRNSFWRTVASRAR